MHLNACCDFVGDDDTDRLYRGAILHRIVFVECVRLFPGMVLERILQLVVRLLDHSQLNCIFQAESKNHVTKIIIVRVRCAGNIDNLVETKLRIL